jgi:pimeloyl-ACP methyl ester carboxylesterase
VALRTALDAPHRVDSLVLYEPTVFGLLSQDDESDASVEIETLTRMPNFFSPAPEDLEDWLGTFVEYWSRAPVWGFTSRAQKDALLAVGPKVVAEVREVLTGGHGLDAARISQPTLVICGERSTAAAKRMAELLVDILPRGTLATVPRLGHMAPLHRAEPIVENALTFLAQLNQRAGPVTP